MKIISVRERLVPLGSATSNAAISFESMTASAVVIEIETSKGRFHGLGFSSIGRFGHSGLLRERFIPRLLNAKSADLIDPESGEFSMDRFWAVLMSNEKEGGHGERSGAVGVLETAMWDAWAKSEDMPLWALLQREFGHASDTNLLINTPAGRTKIYASGGHYHDDDPHSQRLADETRQALDAGFCWFKLKIGGASDKEDLSRINAAVTAAGQADLIAVDGNCAYDSADKRQVLEAIDQIGLRWIEEPVNPLNYRGLADITESLATSIATGENCFSAADTLNLLQYGGLRSGKDILQMDFVLSYGLTEFVRMIMHAESFDFNRRAFFPHAGHQVALHASAGLGLGAHETASVAGPFGGVSSDTHIEDGIAILSDAPGTGIENKPALYKLFDELIG